MHLMMQPMVAHTLFKNELNRGQGFLARVLIMQPESTMGERLYKAPPPEAIALFANKDAPEAVVIASYETYVEKFKEVVTNLLHITPNAASVDALQTEKEELSFIQAFREVTRVKNVLECFTEFTFDDLPLDEQLFSDFRSKYLDLHDKVKK